MERRDTPPRTQLTRQSAQGAAYSAIGTVLPSALGGDEWVKSGTELQEQGQAEVEAAKSAAAVDATVDATKAKVKS